MSLDSLYQQIILEHAKARHGGGLEGQPGPREAQSHQLNPVCGDEVTVRVRVDDGVVRSLRWDGAGCSISMASASVLHDEAEGLTVAEFGELVEAFRAMLRSRGTVAADPEVLGDAAAFEGVSRYAARVKCAMIAWVAAEDAARQAAAGTAP
ncbi:nitrogen fixation protein NifU [Sinomonas atrocyanea]|uniref:Nitrogen fixation protein NifU n=1 Tax=Sinomonas atrocyanea TaxID=37927 RepID=A0A126ZZX1_9MICC|nr:SUF system NifU family Fe-S cluster assembly protein [Sinomonas atrocyanea]AMM32151.1 nitrogen fixation protein NifU [Sinomonas atrocyanea]GEB64751.1 putative SUF system FeS assembly protein [Sinomonas atrocyanea]GGG81424.1 putative SUF system FeS assembly protein [Sinomonas atrocyanea]